VRELAAESAEVALAPIDRFAMTLQEKVELRTMLAVSEGIVLGALAREETRGAHVRLDFPETAPVAVSRAFRRAGERWDVRPAGTAVAA
jgi:succinate dehydrogenase / fumarate reductase flavoprotein subunit/fumarate reductase (CoM/CoB) subunit A